MERDCLEDCQSESRDESWTRLSQQIIAEEIFPRNDGPNLRYKLTAITCAQRPQNLCRMYKAVVFDIGGVCVHSPLEGIRSFEAAKGIPQNYLNVAIQSRGEAGAFQQLERGKLSLSEFYPLFGQECSDQANVEHYNAYLRRKGLPDLVNFTPVQVDGKELFLRMMEEATKLDPIVVNAVRKLRESGKFKVAALTNNFQPEDAGDGGLAFGSPPSELVSLFHEYIESSLVGLRKPDPEFFRFACRKIGVEPRFAIMLDDIGPNLKAAADVGMTTIRVVVGKSKEAIRQLEALTGVVLLDPVDTTLRPAIDGSWTLHIGVDGPEHSGCGPKIHIPFDEGVVIIDKDIEVPSFSYSPQEEMYGHITSLFPNKSNQTDDLFEQYYSDPAYDLRHRKHEKAEKRFFNREKEYVRHQLHHYKLLPPRRLAPHKREKIIKKNRKQARPPLPYLKSRYISHRPPLSSEERKECEAETSVTVKKRGVPDSEVTEGMDVPMSEAVPMSGTEDVHPPSKTICPPAAEATAFEPAQLPLPPVRRAKKSAPSKHHGSSRRSTRLALPFGYPLPDMKEHPFELSMELQGLSTLSASGV